MILRLARRPNGLDAERPIIIDQLLDLGDAGLVEARDAMIEMMADLHANGRDSRYLKSMKGPIWELKTRSRGGEKGGSRVYLFITEHDEACIVNCEVKDDDSPDPQKLKEVLQVLAAFKAGVPVLEERKAS